MASSREYLEFVLDQLSLSDGIAYKSMMGEYIIYLRGKVIGGIYDDRFLIKNTKAAAAMLPGASLETPYEGAKKMLLVDRIDDRTFLRSLLEAAYAELPAPKNRGRRAGCQ